MMTPTPPVKMPVAHTASAADPISTAFAPWMPASACGIAINSGSPGGYVGTWYDDPAGRHPSGVVSHGSEPCRTSASGLGMSHAPSLHISAWLRYPDASAPAADRVANVEATIAPIKATTPMSRDAFRSIARQAASRSAAIARSRRASANHAPPAISAAIDAANGDQI